MGRDARQAAGMPLRGLHSHAPRPSESAQRRQADAHARTPRVQSAARLRLLLPRLPLKMVEGSERNGNPARTPNPHRRLPDGVDRPPAQRLILQNARRWHVWGFSVLEAQLPALTPQARHAATWRACEASDDYTVTIVSAAVGVAAEAAVAAHPSDAAAVEAVVAYASHADDDGDGGRCWRTRVRPVAPLPPQRMRLRRTPRLSSACSCRGSCLCLWLCVCVRSKSR